LHGNSPMQRHRVRRSITVVLVLCALAFTSAASASLAEDIAALLAPPAAQIELAGAVLWSTPYLRALYAAGEQAPLWNAQRLTLLRKAIAASADDGLDPRDYLQDLLANGRGLRPAVAELLATEALARLAFTLHFGKSNPHSLNPDFNYSRSFGTTAPADWLRRTITGDALDANLADLRPTGAYYDALIAALATHRALAARGTWPQVGPGDTLKPGQHDSRIPALRARLARSGDLALSAAAASDTRYDDHLVTAVETFQRRHGLSVDGAVGRATLAALNVSVDERIAQIRINLERIRWAFRDRSDEFVAVNIAAFEAVYFDDGVRRWRGRAIVGRPYRQTPIFKDEITYVEVNPTWTVPPTILREDILPKLRRDPGYLRAHNLRVIDPNGGPISAASIDWSAVSAARFPYLLRQMPGPDNALGRIKFMFPNPHAVYLHDTPARTLFDRAERSFSSGCIRIEDPLTLAVLLLGDESRWDRAALDRVIANGQTRRIDLPHKVPILLLYLTAFPGEHGEFQFRRDIYARDPAVLAALDAPLRWVPLEMTP